MPNGLVRQGKAYPCFCTEDELAAIREKQAERKENFGYYGKWAVYRDMPFDEVRGKLEAGEPFVLRFRSEGDPARRVKFTDLVKGTMELPENDQDVVLLKSDGIPTYHFAHVVDDISWALTPCGARRGMARHAAHPIFSFLQRWDGGCRNMSIRRSL